jgi:iron complex outermembrane receptor protein
LTHRTSRNVEEVHKPQSGETGVSLRRKLVGASLAVMCAVMSMGAASAQQAADSTDVVIVTATKRATDINDVPFSVNAQSMEDIQRTGATNLEDISRNVAGLTIQNLGPGQSQVAVRGVASGQIVRDQPGVKEQVGVYLDESVVSLSLFTPDLDLYDLSRVETLRGPQGTLYGSGNVGGTVRYITNQPELGEFGGSVEANLNAVKDGEYGGHLKGAVNVPLGDKVAARLVGYYTDYAGFVDALTRTGTIEDANSGTREGGRLSVAFEPNANLRITPRVLYQKIETDGFNREEKFNIFANPVTLGARRLGEREQFLRLREAFEDETTIADLTVDWNLGPVELISVSSYTDRDILVSRDASALTHSVSLDLGLALGATNIPSNLRDTTQYESFTQELRLSSTGEGPLQWLVGAFYADTTRDYAQRLPTPGYDPFVDAALGAGTSAAVRNGFPLNSPFNSDLSYSLEQMAVFGEASYDFTDRFTLTFGGRWYDFEEDRTISSGGLFANGDSGKVDRTSSDGFTPRLIGTYEVSEALTLNLQASQGFRLGGVNDPLNPALCTPQDRAIFGGFQSYQDEKLWNYEGGFKYNAGGVSFNAAAFYNDISDLQVTLDAGSCSSRIVFNVPEAHASGLEYEVAFSPIDGLDLSFSGSVTESEFDSTVRDGTGAPIGGIIAGNRLPTVPEFQMAAAATYRWDPGFAGADAVFSGSLQHVGARYTQPSDQLATQGLPARTGLVFGGFTGNENPRELVNTELDAYTTVNLSAGLEWESVTLTLYATNLLDENPQLSFDRERGGRARLGYNIGQPRTIGVTARRTF